LKEISCKLTAGLVRWAREHGMSPQAITSGQPHLFEDLQRTKNRIDWDHMVTLVRNIRSHFGDDETMVRIGRDDLLNSASYDVYKKMASAVVSAERLYRILVYHAAPVNLSVVRGTFQLLEDHRAKITYEIDPHYQECREFFFLSKGVASAIPELLGLPVTQIEMTTDGRRGEYVFKVPPSLTLWARLARMWRGAFSPTASFSELSLSHGQLRSAYRELSKLNSTLEKRVKEATQEIVHQQTILAEKSKMDSLGDLAGGLAHELNNPLAIIQASQDRISRTQSLAVAKEESQRISRVSDRIAHVANSLKIFARGAEESQTGYFTPDSVLDWIEPLVRSLSHEHGFSLEVEPCGSQEQIYGDRKIIVEALLSLVRNSISAIYESPKDCEGKIKITAEVNSGTVCFLLQDNGVGIDPKLSHKIFNPFFSTRQPQGAGLGLSTSKTALERMGGALELVSHSGPTVMRIQVPLGNEIPGRN